MAYNLLAYVVFFTKIMGFGHNFLVTLVNIDKHKQGMSTLWLWMFSSNKHIQVF